MKYKFHIKGLSDWVGLNTRAIQTIQAGKEFLVEIETELNRSLDQNSLIHAVFKQCAEKTKIKDASWWKDELKSKLGKKSVHFDLEDNPTIIIISTKEYKKSEISDFIEKIKHHMATNYQIEIVTKDEHE